MSINISSKVYGDLSGSVFQPEVKSIANVTTGTLPIARGGTGLTSVGASGSVLFSNGSELVYGQITVNTGSSPIITGSITSAPEYHNEYGSAILTRSFGPNTRDDAFLSIALPFNFTFFGVQYDTAYLSSNSYVTFGNGSSHYSSNTVADWLTNVPYPGIFISADDNSYQNVFRGVNPNNSNEFIIRFEGTNTTSGPTSGPANMLWEMRFFNDGTNNIVVNVIRNEPNLSRSPPALGTSFLSNGTSSYGIFSPVSGSDWLITTISSSGTEGDVTLTQLTGALNTLTSSLSASYIQKSGGMFTGEVTASAGISSSFYRINGTDLSSATQLNSFFYIGASTGDLLNFTQSSTTSNIYYSQSYVGSPTRARGITISPDGNKIFFGQGNLLSIYSSSSAGWTLETTFTGSGIVNSGLNGNFGQETAVNASGNKLIAGEITGDEFLNKAYIYNSSSLGWNLEAVLTGSLVSDNRESFGASVKMNSLGNEVYVAAIEDEPSGSVYSSNIGPGLVYVFASSSNGWEQKQILSGSLATSYFELFGYSISVDSSSTRMLIGSPYENNLPGAQYRGCAYYFTSGSSGWVERQILTPSGPYTYAENFGISVAISPTGDKAIIGATGDQPTPGTAGGAAYVFVSSSYGWIEEARLIGDYAISSDDSFGNSVSINSTGNLIAVGAYFDELSGFSNTGLVYIFESSSYGWNQKQIITGSNSLSNYSYFGYKTGFSNNNRLAISSDARPYVFNLYGGVTTTSSFWTASKTLTGSYTINEILQLQSLSTLPAGNLGLLAVYGSNLYFHDGNSWRIVSLT